MKAPCYQHDSYDSTCSSCRELNGVPQRKPRCEFKVYRKPQYTGFPPMARDCFHDATRTVNGQRLCTRHARKVSSQ